MRSIKFLLYRVRRAARPSRAERQRIWETVAKQLGSQGGAISWYYQSWFRVSIAALVGIVLISFGTGAYAYSSPDVTAGAVLYPVKLALENVEEKIKFSPAARARFYLKKIERREAEKATLQKKNKPSATLDSQINTAEIKLEKVERELREPEQREIKDQVRKALDKRHRDKTKINTSSQKD